MCSEFNQLDLERIERAKDESPENVRQRTPSHVVRLTNYGDGTAHDVRLKGQECRPRVWVGDAGKMDQEGRAKVAWPMWDRTIPALDPGESKHIFVMCLTDDRNVPVVTASWPVMPRRGLWRRTIHIDLSKAETIETGWPGKSAG